MTSPVVLTVVYTGEPDVVHEFPEDGIKRTFGRDEDGCDIVIWSAINERDLSRRAGVIWRMDDQLWVRNLSTRHELTVHAPDRLPEPPLPPRLEDGFDRGPARAVPAGHAFVRGPNGCELLVRQLWPLTGPAADSAAISVVGEGPPPALATETLPGLPDDLRPVALALCEPLLLGRLIAAPYTQVAQRLGCSVKTARTTVNRLTDRYADHVPALKRSIEQRRLREQAALDLASHRVLRHGVWTFQGDEAPGRPGPGPDTREDPLALPAYQEVAQLLVLRGVVRATQLPDHPDHPNPGSAP